MSAGAWRRAAGRRMRLSAIDSIQHGLLNLRANWQLVIVQFLQTLAVTLIATLGLLPIVFALGFAFVRSTLKNFDASSGSELLERVLEAGVPLVVGLLATTLIWTIAFVVFCYFQGGILGVLAAGERQAQPAGAGWKSYYTFSTRLFYELAEQLTWPVFWLVNLFVVIGTAALAGFGLLAVGPFVLFGEGSEALQIGLGCVALLVFAVFMMFLSVWMQLAQVELALGTRGVLAAAKQALKTTLRRLPGLALLLLLLIVASITMAIVFVPVSMVLEFAFRSRLGAYFTGQAVISLVQWLVSGVLSVGWAAVCVALVNGEHEKAD